MADLEPRVEKLEQKVSELELRTDRVITKLDMFIEESREARQRQDAEIRELRQRQEAEIREFRQRQDAAQAKHDADMKEMQKNIYAKMDNMDSKIERMTESNRNMFIVTMIGIATMAIAVFLK